MRCKHEFINITEFGTSWTHHELEEGEWSHHSDIGSYTGTIDVHCYDCGLEKTYHSSNRPKWLVKLLESMKD